jgi:hypothetical protein
MQILLLAILVTTKAIAVGESWPFLLVLSRLKLASGVFATVGSPGSMPLLSDSNALGIWDARCATFCCIQWLVHAVTCFMTSNKHGRFSSCDLGVMLDTCSAALHCCVHSPPPPRAPINFWCA